MPNITRPQPDTPLPVAGADWLAHLQSAGVDAFDDDDEFAGNAQRHHSQQTIASYRTALTLFLRWLARQQRSTVATLQFGDLLDFTRDLRRRNYDLSARAARQHADGDDSPRLAARTVHSYARPLLGFLAYLESYGVLPFATAALRTELAHLLPRLPEPLAPTPPDLRRLATYYDRKHSTDDDRTPRLRTLRLRNAALLHMLFSTGARISELLALNVGDVYRDGRVVSRVQVYSKGRRYGTIFVRRHAERVLAVYLQARAHPPASAPLFVSLDRRTEGARLSRVSAWRVVNAAAHAVAAQIELEGKHDEAALLRRTSPHSFRHFVGYHLLNEGVDLAEVSQILRHRTVDVTRNYYARYRDIQLQEVHDQFSADPLGGDLGNDPPV